MMTMRKLNDKDRKMLLALQEGPLRTRELAKILEVTPRAVQKRAGRLLGLGLIEKPKSGHHRLTAQGREYLQVHLWDIGMDFGWLNQLIEQLPSEPQQGFFRLLLSGLVAKAQLFERYETGWPSFLIGGPTKTGKTFLAHLVLRLLGKDGLIKHVQTSTAGELIGRRFQTKEGWGFEPSPYFQEPFICLDELDKATGELQKQALYYLQGERRVLIEGAPVEVRVLPLVTLNTDPAKGFGVPGAYRRRAVTLDTGPIREELQDIDLVAQKLLISVPCLDLSRLIPSEKRLSDEAFMDLRQLLQENLTEAGWGLIDPPAVALLVLGRSVFTGDIGEAIYQTVYDRLLCAETTGHTQSGWRARLSKAWKRYRAEAQVQAQAVAPSEADQAEVFPPLPLPESQVRIVESELGERLKAVKGERFEKVKETAVFIEARSRLVEGFGLLHDRLMEIRGEHNKRVTKPLRNKLNYYKRQAQAIKVGDEEALSAYERILEEARGEVERLHGQYQQMLSRIEARRQERRRLSEQVAHLKKELAPYQRYLNRKRTRSDEDVVGTLVQLECLEWQLETHYVPVLPSLAEDLVDLVVGLKRLWVRYQWKEYSLQELQRWAGFGSALEEPDDPYRHLNPYTAQASRVTEQQRRFAQDVLQGLEQRVSWVRVRGDTVKAMVENPPPPKREPQLVARHRRFLVGCDGEEYSEEQVSRWEQPAVKQLLAAKAEPLRKQLASFEQQLQTLALGSAEELPQLAELGEVE